MLDEFQAVVKEVEAEEAALQTEYEELEVLRDDLLVKQSNLESLLSEKNLQILRIWRNRSVTMRHFCRI